MTAPGVITGWLCHNRVFVATSSSSTHIIVSCTYILLDNFHMPSYFIKSSWAPKERGGGAGDIMLFLPVRKFILAESK